MNWKKKTLLAVISATALVGVAASASAEEWGFYFSPQTTSYYDHDRSDNSGYRYDNRDYGRDHDYRSRYWSHDAYDRGGRGWTYDNNRTYGARSWNNNDGYVQQDRGYHPSYGRNDDDDD